MDYFYKILLNYNVIWRIAAIYINIKEFIHNLESLLKTIVWARIPCSQFYNKETKNLRFTVDGYVDINSKVK